MFIYVFASTSNYTHFLPYNCVLPVFKHFNEWISLFSLITYIFIMLFCSRGIWSGSTFSRVELVPTSSKKPPASLLLSQYWVVKSHIMEGVSAPNLDPKTNKYFWWIVVWHQIKPNRDDPSSAYAWSVTSECPIKFSRLQYRACIKIANDSRDWVPRINLTQCQMPTSERVCRWVWGSNFRLEWFLTPLHGSIRSCQWNRLKKARRNLCIKNPGWISWDLLDCVLGRYYE